MICVYWRFIFPRLWLRNEGPFWFDIEKNSNAQGFSPDSESYKGSESVVPWWGAIAE